MSIQRKLRTCAAAKCVTATRHIGVLPSGVNRQIYPASMGMSSEIMASGAPRKILALQERWPSVVSAGISTSATGIQMCLLTLTMFDFDRSGRVVIAASVADLHAPKNCRAHHNQSFFRLVRIDRPRVARRIRIAAKNPLASRCDVPGFRNAQFDATKNCIGVKHGLVFAEFCISHIVFNASEHLLKLTATQGVHAHTLLHSSKTCNCFPHSEPDALAWV